MKKQLFFLAFVLCTTRVLAQDDGSNLDNWQEVTVPQTTTWIYVKMAKKERSYGYGQQFYTATVTNNYGKRLHIVGNIYANLTCGNQDTSHVDFYLDPGEKKGGRAYLADATGLTGSAESEECAGDPIMSNGKQIGTNRISSIGGIGTNFKIIVAETENQATNSNSNAITTANNTTNTSNNSNSSTSNTYNSNTQNNSTQAASNYATTTYNNNLQAQRNYEQQKRQAEQAAANAKVAAVKQQWQQKDAQDKATMNEVHNSINSVYQTLLDQQAQNAAKDEAREQERRNEELAKKQEEAAEQAKKEARDAEIKALEERARARREQRDREEMEERRKEEARIAAENERLLDKCKNIVPPTLMQYSNSKMPNDENTGTLTSVYYVIWNFGNDNQVLVADPIEIKKSPDGDWPLKSEVHSKINTESKLVLNSVAPYLLGFFKTKETATNVLNIIKDNAKSSGYAVKSITEAEPEKKTSTNTKDFWKE